ncbi:pre-toxin TG domain-containing protein, partial [Bacillus pumilus]|uniref:pre-toxin TG domain-containing protein n=1 Tax=Bacillus pumilus TaxID=1408 RepID=UPI003593DE5D
VNDAKRAATGVDPITGEELTAGQRVAAGGMAAAGYIPIVGWAGRIFKGGKAVYKTTQATSAAVRAVDIYKTSQKSFDALKTSQKGLYGLTATNGFSETITGRDMFGNKVSKEQQEASMNAALGMLLPFGAKGIKSNLDSINKPKYIPKDKNGKNASLPKNENGKLINGTVHKPDSQFPHTQIGYRKGRKAGYIQTLEWGKDGTPIQRTDWTNHGRGDHTNPHSHPAVFKDGSWSFKE